MTSPSKGPDINSGLMLCHGDGSRGCRYAPRHPEMSRIQISQLKCVALGQVTVQVYLIIDGRAGKTWETCEGGKHLNLKQSKILNVEPCPFLFYSFVTSGAGRVSLRCSVRK